MSSSRLKHLAQSCTIEEAAQLGLDDQSLVRAAGTGLPYTGHELVTALAALDQRDAAVAVHQNLPSPEDARLLMRLDRRAMVRRQLLDSCEVGLHWRLVAMADKDLFTSAVAGASDAQRATMLEHVTTTHQRRHLVESLACTDDPDALRALRGLLATYVTIDADVALIVREVPAVADAVPAQVDAGLSGHDAGTVLAALEPTHPAVAALWRTHHEGRSVTNPSARATTVAIAAGLPLPAGLLDAALEQWTGTGTVSLFNLLSPALVRELATRDIEAGTLHLGIDGLQQLAQIDGPHDFLAHDYRLVISDEEQVDLEYASELVASLPRLPKGFAPADTPRVRELLAVRDADELAQLKLTGTALAVAVMPNPRDAARPKQLAGEFVDELRARLEGRGRALETLEFCEAVDTLLEHDGIDLDEAGRLLADAIERGGIEHVIEGSAHRMLAQVLITDPADRADLLERHGAVLVPTGHAALDRYRDLGEREHDLLLEHLPAAALPSPGPSFNRDPFDPSPAMVRRVRSLAADAGADFPAALRTLASLLDQWTGTLAAACETAVATCARSPRAGPVDADDGTAA